MLCSLEDTVVDEGSNRRIKHYNLDNRNIEKKLNHTEFGSVLQSLSINGVHKINCQKNPYHFLIEELDRSNEYILVSFHGLQQRKTGRPPYFCYMTLAKNLNVGLISISDPSLLLDDELRLSWHVGNKVNGNVAKEIATFLDRVADTTGKKLILCGGSGGGFAALNIQQLMSNAFSTKAVVFNPQTDITKYHEHILQKYFSSCFYYKNSSSSNIEKYFIDNGYSIKIDNKNSELQRFILINGSDPNHVRKHVSRFINLKKEGNTTVCFGDWGLGHIPPKREVHWDILERIMNGESFHSVSADVSSKYKPALIFVDHKKYLDEKISVKFWSIDNYIIITHNIVDYFIGFSITYIITDKVSGREVYNSGYVTSVDLDGVTLDISDISEKTHVNLLLTLQVEDVLGNAEQYYFPFENKIIKKTIRK